MAQRVADEGGRPQQPTGDTTGGGGRGFRERYLLGYRVPKSAWFHDYWYLRQKKQQEHCGADGMIGHCVAHSRDWGGLRSKMQDETGRVGQTRISALSVKSEVACPASVAVLSCN